ncbi:MAG: hypothetical protein HKN41_05475 [Ilumatobacter sp.]|nr:hypothetical protein [Ilumatobacter sp.]
MLKNISVPDVSAPDASSLADEIKDLAGAAADAVSSAAGHVPGLDDYRAVKQRRRSLMWTLGAVGVVVLVLMLVKKRQESSDDQS